MTPFDVERARSETPGCERVIHLNNAGASLAAAPVLEAVIGYLRDEAMTGGYEMADREAAAVGRYRASLAQLLIARSDEVAFAASDTAAWSTALWGFIHTGAVPHGSRVLVDRGAYSSHYLGLLQAAQVAGLRIDVIPGREDGSLDVDAMVGLLDDDVSLVSLTHVGTHRGLVNPVEAAGAALTRSGAIYVLDACQSVGQMPVDVGAIGCHVLTATGRKFLRAPRGSGLLWVRHDLIERIDPPGIDGHSVARIDAHGYELLPDAGRLEAFEASMAVKVGLGVAADYAMAWGLGAIGERIAHLSERLRSELSQIDGVVMLDGGGPRSGIVTFRPGTTGAAAMQAHLSAAGINVSVARPAGAPLDMTDRGVDEAVRASVHYFNTDDEIDAMVDEVERGVHRAWVER